MAHIRTLTNRIPQPVRFGLRRVLHGGHGVTCVLCGTEVRAFRSHGGGAEVLERRRVAGGMRRENDRCPVCHGCDRTRLIMLYLEAVAGVGSGPCRVLHVAPDYGLFLWLMRQPGVDYTGADIDPGRYRHIRNFHGADLTDTPFADNTFDIVICSHVLEHVPDDAGAFREISRILRPGGRALLLVPFALDGHGTDEDPALQDPAARNHRFGQWDHVRLYDRGDFLARMDAAGLETELFEPLQSHPAEAAWLRLNPLEVLPVGLKPSV